MDVESWTIKKAECQRIAALELSCQRRLLKVPWTARRSNQSILKEISPEYSLEGLMLKLKLQYFGHLKWRTDSFEKTLLLGMIKGGRRKGRRGWDGCMASPTQWTWVRVNSGSWWWTGRPSVVQSMGSQGVGHDWATELNWSCVGVIPPLLCPLLGVQVPTGLCLLLSYQTLCGSFFIALLVEKAFRQPPGHLQ